MDISSIVILALMGAVIFVYPVCSIWLVLVTRGTFRRAKDLEAHGKLEHAIDAYLAGTRWMVIYPARARATSYAHVAKLYFQLQQWCQASEWAERSLVSRPTASVELSARHTAAHAAYELDQREQAVTHFERLGLLARAGTHDQLANYAYWFSAVVHVELGQFEEATTDCDCMQSNPEYSWLALMNRVKCFFLQGQFDLAWQLIPGLASDAVENEQLWQNRRYHTIAWKIATCIALEKIDLAWEIFQDAADSSLQNDNMLLWRAVVESLLSALRDEPERATQQIKNALQILAHCQRQSISEDMPFVWPPAPGDHQTKSRRELFRSCYAGLAHAQFCLRDYTQAQTLWKQSLTFNSAPVLLPEAYYSLGECDRAMGNLTSAAEWYHAAANLKIATHHAALARERLEQMQTTRISS